MSADLPDLPAEWDDDDGVDPPPAATPPDPWLALRRHTSARIALGRAGTSLPTAEVLRFAAAHARARDAVHAALDVAALEAALQAQGVRVVRVRSRAATRADYLARPDLGRRLDAAAHEVLAGLAPSPLCVVIGDGLSAVAAQAHAGALVAALRALLEPAGVRVDAVVVATQARVALGDEIGAAVGAELVLVLLGERPGLSSPDSLGAYLTWAPRPGRADAERNCVSNIRPEGLAVAAAAARLAWLVREAARRRVTGIALKDDSAVASIPSA